MISLIVTYENDLQQLKQQVIHILYESDTLHIFIPGHVDSVDIPFHSNLKSEQTSRSSYKPSPLQPLICKNEHQSKILWSPVV